MSEGFHVHGAQPGDHLHAGLMTLLFERRHEVALAARRPQQRGLWIAARRGLDQGFQIGQQLRIFFSRLLAPAARPSITTRRQRLRTPALDRPHLRDPPSDDTRRHPRGARGRRNAAVSESDRLVRNEKATGSLIEAAFQLDEAITDLRFFNLAFFHHPQMRIFRTHKVNLLFCGGR